MQINNNVALLYHTYNSLFLSLPFRDIEETGTLLALFGQECRTAYPNGMTPEGIVETYWQEYMEENDASERLNMLFYFIQYIERQVVLFDSVEDALFEQMHDVDGRGSVKHLLARFDDASKRAALTDALRQYSVRLVLTAHPTQFYPGNVLGIINDLGQEIRDNKLENIRLLLMQLGKTAFVNRERPSPYDEAIRLGWYLENVFYEALPDIVFRFLRGLDQNPVDFENPKLLTLGFWPGGDRDGNPFVTADITRLVATRLREGALRGYYRDIRSLKRRLTFRGVEACIATAERKIYNTLYNPGEVQYGSCQELIADLLEARLILVDEHDGLFLEDLDRFILKVRIFGFYFASLDIRQDSRRHTEVWGHILAHWQDKFPWYKHDRFEDLDENTRMERLLTTNYALDENDYADVFVKETLRSFRCIDEIQKENGESSCHRYIISNCQSALNVAEVLALAKLTGANAKSPEAQVNLDIVPLFETIDDLAECPAIMEKLYTNPHYARHLLNRSNEQHIMLGFSDGTKDGGYLRANWSIYRAKTELTRVSRQYGIKVVFFDGRGGPPGRGGGNNTSYYASQGADIENNAIQVTIQGQTVSSTYGTLAAAKFNIERLLSAGLMARLDTSGAAGFNAADLKLMDELADAAYEAYLELKNNPAFVPYLENVTPLKWYGDTNIASRPTKRGDNQGLKFEDLRAIPFVGAWAQMKQNVPGYYGVGAAWEKLKTLGKGKAVRDLYTRNLFFRTLLENSMQSLQKSNFDVTKHLENHKEYGAFWHMLYEEYQRTTEALSDLSGRELLSDNPGSRNSIALRESIVLPLITIQQFALQKLQNDKLTTSQADVYRRLVLRAMFGIINAARNAA